MRTDTIFDMASVSKLFTSIVVLQLVGRARSGWTRRSRPTCRSSPRTARRRSRSGRRSPTPPGCPPGCRCGARGRTRPRGCRWRSATPTSPAGTKYLYSDLNLIALGEVAHRVTGKTLDKLVADGITKALQMQDTATTRTPEEVADRRHGVPVRAAARDGLGLGRTTRTPGRWTASPGTPVCSTPPTTWRFWPRPSSAVAATGTRILQGGSVTAMITNFNQAFPGNDHGLGFELNQALVHERAVRAAHGGHTEYTGRRGDRLRLPFVRDPAHQPSSASRNWAATTGPACGRARGWRCRSASGRGTARTPGSPGPRTPRRPRWPRRSPYRPRAKLDFDMFVDTEDTDLLSLETSADGTTWTKVPFTVLDRDVIDTDGTIRARRDRHWHQVFANLAGGDRRSGGVTRRRAVSRPGRVRRRREDHEQQRCCFSTENERLNHLSPTVGDFRVGDPASVPVAVPWP